MHKFWGFWGPFGGVSWTYREVRGRSYPTPSHQTPRKREGRRTFAESVVRCWDIGGKPMSYHGPVRCPQRPACAPAPHARPGTESGAANGTALVRSPPPPHSPPLSHTPRVQAWTAPGQPRPSAGDGVPPKQSSDGIHPHPKLQKECLITVTVAGRTDSMLYAGTQGAEQVAHLPVVPGGGGGPGLCMRPPPAPPPPPPQVLTDSWGGGVASGPVVVAPPGL